MGVERLIQCSTTDQKQLDSVQVEKRGGVRKLICKQRVIARQNLIELQAGYSPQEICGDSHFPSIVMGTKVPSRPMCSRHLSNVKPLK